MLAEPIESQARVMPSRHRVEGDLRAGILRSPMLRRTDWRVIRIAVVISAIVVIERRDREQQPRREGVDPREIHYRVALALDVAYAGRLSIRIVRDLIIIAA